jgi:hypothetical protein
MREAYPIVRAGLTIVGVDLLLSVAGFAAASTFDESPVWRVSATFRIAFVAVAIALLLRNQVARLLCGAPDARLRAIARTYELGAVVILGSWSVLRGVSALVSPETAGIVSSCAFHEPADFWFVRIPELVNVAAGLLLILVGRAGTLRTNRDPDLDEHAERLDATRSIRATLILLAAGILASPWTSLFRFEFILYGSLPDQTETHWTVEQANTLMLHSLCSTALLLGVGWRLLPWSARARNRTSFALPQAETLVRGAFGFLAAWCGMAVVWLGVGISLRPGPRLAPFFAVDRSRELDLAGVLALFGVVFALRAARRRPESAPRLAFGTRQVCGIAIATIGLLELSRHGGLLLSRMLTSRMSENSMTWPATWNRVFDANRSDSLVFHDPLFFTAHLRDLSDQIGASYFLAPVAAVLFLIAARRMAAPRGRIGRGMTIEPKSVAVVAVVCLGTWSLLDALHCWHVANTIPYFNTQKLNSFQRWILLPVASAWLLILAISTAPRWLFTRQLDPDG